MDKNKELSSMIPEDIKYASVMYLKNIAMDYCSNQREVYSEQDIIDVCEQVPLLYDVYNFSRLFGAMVNERPEREGKPIYYVSFLRSKEMHIPMYELVSKRKDKLTTFLFDSNFIRYVVSIIRAVKDNNFTYIERDITDEKIKKQIEKNKKMIDAMLVAEQFREKNPLKYRKTKVEADDVSIKDYEDSKKEIIIHTDNESAYKKKPTVNDIIDEDDKNDSIIYIKYILKDLNGKKFDYDYLEEHMPLIYDIDALSRLYGVFVSSGQMDEDEFTNTIMDSDLAIQMYISVKSRTDGVKSYADDSEFIRYVDALARIFSTKKNMEEYLNTCEDKKKMA